jgi:dihydrofolate reductase
MTADPPAALGKVFTALAVSVDGFITGRGPGPGHGLGDGGMLFGWYFDGDTPSQVFDGFRLSEPSRDVFDDLAGRIGAVVAGRNTYDDSDGFGGRSPHPAAPLVVVSHRPAPSGATDKQTFVTSIEAGIESARAIADGRDIGVMGGGVTTAALRAGLLDEVILHQVPVLLGDGRRFFGELPAHIGLSLVEAVPAPGVIHLRYRIEKGRRAGVG